MTGRFEQVDMPTGKTEDTDKLRKLFAEIEEVLTCYTGREVSVALTQLETAAMWATKGVSRGTHV